jgi:acetoin utilization deacetylase AcuC-like enzyme
LGHADETGAGAGVGFNFNFPLPLGTTFAAWGAALDAALGEIRSVGADVLVVSLGLDTFKDDPVGRMLHS